MDEEPDPGSSVDDRMVDLEDECGLVVFESCGQHDSQSGSSESNAVVPKI